MFSRTRSMATESTKISTINHSGIPESEFVDNVDEFMRRSENDSAEAVLRRLDERHNKYKFMEYNLNTKKTRLKSQIPDIKTSLDIVRHLQQRKDVSDPLETRFLLSDQVYAKAKIPPTDKVCLWLGANVMLEYNLDDAQTLLEKNLETARKTLGQVDEDLSFLKDQTTTLEVNMARVYNWDVKRRQKSTVKT